MQYFTNVGLSHLLTLSAFLFVLGLLVIMVRKNFLFILLGMGLMFHSVVINFAAFARHYHHHKGGQAFAFVIIVFTFAQIVLGLGFGKDLYKREKSLKVDDFNQLRD